MSAHEDVAALDAQLSEAYRRVVEAALRPPPNDLAPELQSDLAKYLCILTCGFLEEAIERIVLDYCVQMDSRLHRYFRGEMERFRNPSRQEILTLVGRLDETWKARVQGLLTNNEYSDALEGLLAIRHAIVHGRTATTSVLEAQDYFRRVRVIARYLAELVLPGGATRVEG